MKYKDWLKEWLDNYVEPTTKIRTFNRYHEVVEQHISPLLGDYSLEELSPIVLQKYITDLLKTGNIKTGSGLSASSVNMIITIIQSSLKLACTLGYLKEYTANRIKRPKPNEKEVECFTPQEQKKMEQYVLSNKKPKMIGVLICLYTGLRIGELLALEWNDIDFQKGLMYVSKSCHDGKDRSGNRGRITDTPKTSSSKRIIPLPKQVMPILRDYKKKSHSKLVVSNSDKIISVRSYQRSFELMLNKLEIEHRGFHSLRHTFATRALECGMDVKTLSEILGHKSPIVTLNKYAHSLLEHKKEMMNRIGKLL